MARRRRSRSVLALLTALTALLSGPARASEEAAPSPLPWARGPALAPIGSNLAELQLGEDYVFLDADGTRRFMELTENPVSGNELATVSPVSDDAQWFVVFEFDEIGYVPDDEKDSLDADAMLDSIREGTKAANEERRKRGWTEMEIVGWHEPPHYDARTNNLSWAIAGRSGEHQNVNRTVKLLGRRGVMTATLVAAPEDLPSAIPAVESMLAGYHFKPGSTYAEYVAGKDTLASYGLTALVVGGAGAALVKTGLLAKLWKPLAVALVAVGATIKRIFFGGRKAETKLEGPIG